MIPNISRHDPGYVALTNSVFTRYLRLWSRVASYAFHHLRRQPRVAVLLAKGVAALCYGVSVVCGLRPCRQMGGIYAWRIIAGVHDDEPNGNRTVRQLEGVAMGSDSLLARQNENSVPVVILIPGPLPTSFVGLLHPRPEHFIGADLGVTLKRASLAGLVVVVSAQVSGKRWLAANGAWKFRNRLVRHGDGL